MKIYKTYACYEDYDSSSMVTIGVFSDYAKALDAKKKWMEFHISLSYPEIPHGWDPKKDDWYSEEYDFNWEDSLEYQKEISKAGVLINLTEIKIDEYELDEDRFSRGCYWDDCKKGIIERFDRDYKIKSVICSEKND